MLYEEHAIHCPNYSHSVWYASVSCFYHHISVFPAARFIAAESIAHDQIIITLQACRVLGSAQR